MRNNSRPLFFALMFISVASATAFCGPSPQGNPQGATPASHPAQAQVVLAPAPVQTGKPAPQEPLPADARRPDLLLRVGHTQSVEALAFSPGGKWLASGGYDKSIIVWNLSSGREEFHLGGLPVPLAAASPSLNKQAVSALAFNPDGTRLVSGGSFRRSESMEPTKSKSAIHYPSAANSLLWGINQLQR